MSEFTPLTPDIRSKVWDAVSLALHAVRPELFAVSGAKRPGDVSELESHLEPLVDITRRTTAARIEPYLCQFLDEICPACPHQSPCAYCDIRGKNECVLFSEAKTIIDAAADALRAAGDPDYVRLHPAPGNRQMNQTPEQGSSMRNSNTSRRPLPILQRAQTALRVAVCHSCPRRPAGSEAVGSDTPLACEPGCEVFQQLPRLVRTADCLDPMIGSFQSAMNARIDDICATTTAPPPDGYGPRPLVHHRRRILAALAKLARR